ncbi:hypothetical protein L0Y65_05690 [Candidatus Micrarchaeota archaeon]|nr:hypothetical protein [Candidatus Micrarchaeota archaeon]
MADAGEEEDIFRKRADEFAISTYASNREGLIRFYQDLARMGKEKIPAQMKSEDEAPAALADAGKCLDDSVKLFAETATGLSEEGASTAVARLCLAMFLIERVKKLREISIRLDDLGVFSLYVTLRNRVTQTLSPSFFAGPSRDMLDKWLDLEPLLTACSGLCGLAVPELGEIMDEYQPRVVDAVAKIQK